MAETRREVRVFRIDFVCESCNKGNMVATGEMLTSNPPWYIHKCDNCGVTEKYFNKSYPSVEQEVIDE